MIAFLNIIWKAMISKGLNAMISKGLNAMSALSKFLVLLSLVLLASHANAFTSLSLVAGDQVQVQVNHLT